MKFAILHLSDIHFRPFHQFVLQRVKGIAAALTSASLDWENLLIVLSGDIAYGGKPAEYSIARQFLEALRSEISCARPNAIQHVLMVPGNHDCDYQVEATNARDLILTALRIDHRRLKESATTLEQLLAVQDAYESFRKSVMTEKEERPTLDRLLSSVDIRFGDETIRVNLLNSAIACQHRPGTPGEQETDLGKLFFPFHLFPTANYAPRSYAITVIHHPVNWFESSNSVEMRHHLRKTSDLILVGHQHEDDATAEEAISNDKCLLVRAEALQEEPGGGSGFNIVIVDLERFSERVILHEWTGLIYAVKQQKIWESRKDPRSSMRRLALANDWKSHLDDVGTGFTHPNKKSVSLSDIYVAPELNVLIGSSNKDDELPRKRQRVSAELMKAARLSIITGETRSGKTTIGKRLFRELYEGADELCPVLLSGDDLKISRPTPERVWAAVARQFTHQYEEGSTDVFAQLPADKRAIIVDDWHHCGLNEKGKEDLLKALSERFSVIVLLAENSERIDRVTRYTQSFETHGPLRAYEIAPFGHFLRAVLIKRWLRLGRERTLSDDQLQKEVQRAERMLDSVLGKSLLPSYPFFLFSLLQIENATRSTQHTNGSYGYLYESLITIALAGASKDITDVDVTYTVLGRIANALYSGGKEGLSAYELDSIVHEYAVEYKADVDSATMQNRLLRANILAFEENEYYFRYNYIYYFFVARYLADRLKSPEFAGEVRGKFVELADLIEREREAYIVLFIVYLTRDSAIIGRLLENARGIYLGEPEFDGAKQIEFLEPMIEELASKRIKVSIAADPEENRDAERREMDESASDEDDDPLDMEDARMRMFIRATRSIDLLGQIVRNFPGSMPGKEKVEITSEVYSLGLRLASSLLTEIHANLPKLRAFVETGISADGSRKLGPEELKRKSGRVLVQVCEIMIFGLIKRISSSVGLAPLRPTYDEVRAKLGNTCSAQLIDISIRLDHLGEFPKSRVIQLYEEEFGKKWFPQLMLRHLVVYHFMMFQVDRELVQSVGEKLRLVVNLPEIVGKIAKSLPKVSPKRDAHAVIEGKV